MLYCSFVLFQKKSNNNSAQSNNSSVWNNKQQRMEQNNNNAQGKNNNMRDTTCGKTLTQCKKTLACMRVGKHQIFLWSSLVWEDTNAMLHQHTCMCEDTNMVRWSFEQCSDFLPILLWVFLINDPPLILLRIFFINVNKKNYCVIVCVFSLCVPWLVFSPYCVCVQPLCALLCF